MPKPLDVEERLRRHAVGYRRDMDPSPDLHPGVMARITVTGTARRRSSVLLRDLAVAAAIIVFFGLLALGYSRLHSKPAPADQGFRPSADAIPWVATAPTSARAIPSPIVTTPDQVAGILARTVSGVSPVLVPSRIPAGLSAAVTAYAVGFDITYSNAAQDRQVTMATMVPNPPPPGPNGTQARPKFRGVTADLYQVDDRTQPAGHRLLMWVEPGTWNMSQIGSPGVYYFLASTGLTEAEFWQVANSLTSLPPAQPCRASDLRFALVGAKAGTTGLAPVTILLRSQGASPCTIIGVPGMTIRFTNGASASIGPRLPSSQKEVPPTIILVPSSVATGYLSLTGCQPFSTIGQEMRGVDVRLPGASDVVSVDAGQPGVIAIDVCAGSPSPFGAQMALIQDPAVTARTGPPGIGVRLRLPLRAKAGVTMQYEVTLTNQAAIPFVFSSCPSYLESLDTPQQPKEHYLLNCANAGIVDPGGSVTFAMAFELPAGTPPGRHWLTWTMDAPYSDVTVQAPVIITAS
jgi:hypothetical protein